MSIENADRTGKIKYGILGWLIGLQVIAASSLRQGVLSASIDSLFRI